MTTWPDNQLQPPLPAVQPTKRSLFPPALKLQEVGDLVQSRVVDREVREGTSPSGSPRLTLILTLELAKPRTQYVDGQATTARTWSWWIDDKSEACRALTKALDDAQAPRGRPRIGDEVMAMVMAVTGDPEYPRRTLACRWRAAPPKNDDEFFG